MADSDRVRIKRHTPEGIPDSGSFEIRIDGVAFKYIYWDDAKDLMLQEALAASRAR